MVAPGEEKGDTMTIPRRDDAGREDARAIRGTLGRFVDLAPQREHPHARIVDVEHVTLRGLLL